MTYSLVVDTVSGDLAGLRQGSARLAELAARAAVPVTWVVDERAARSLAAGFAERHESAVGAPSDAFILWLDTAEWLASDDDHSVRAEAVRVVRQRTELPGRIATQRNRLRELLPWVHLTVVGADMKSAALIGALEELGLHGLWGYRWNEASRRAQDRGCPFGFFYANRDRHNSAGAPISRVVAVPRETGDLSHWRRLPPEPSDGDPGRPHVPDHDRSAPTDVPLDLGSIRLALDRTQSSSQVNEWNAVVHTVSAEESASWSTASEGELLALWGDLKERGFEPVSVPDAVATYAGQFPETEPTLLLCATESPVAGSQAAHPREIVYYDGRGQYIFDEGISEPSECFNYVSASGSSQYLTEYEPPTVESLVTTRVREALLLEGVIEAPKAMPYALFLWSDHRHLRLQETDVLEVRWFGKEGILVLLDLEPGTNRFMLELTI